MNTIFSSDLQHLSRRAFLKTARNGLAGLFLMPLFERAVGRERLVTREQFADVPEMGRVLDNTAAVYSEPSFSGRLVNMYWRDLVYPINAVTVGDKEPAHNRVWYLMNGEGYVHSGKVQPVAVRSNVALTSLPARGALVEVSVPFTDVLWDANRPDRQAARLYYSTTYWADKVVLDKQGRRWYRLHDDKYKVDYFARAEHVRPISIEELALLSPEVPEGARRLEVRLSEQVVIAYEDERPVFMSRTATGARFIEGNYTTPTGRFETSRKRPSRHMASGDLAAPSSYDLPGVPWVCYLTLKGISFHGTYWHNDFGRPRSHGCLNLSSQAAMWVYRWTLPNVPPGERISEEPRGTPVDVID